MFFDGLFDRGVTPALVATLSFAEARHKMLAENIANLGTPGYKAQQLDTRAFQRALGAALGARERDPSKPFVLEGREFQTDRSGRLQVTPSLEPVENLLFHDGTNVSVEREMADLAENALTHQLTTSLLQRGFESLRKAIRGRV